MIVNYNGKAVFLSLYIFSTLPQYVCQQPEGTRPVITIEESNGIAIIAVLK